MNNRPHRVHVVVDPNFGDRLTELPPDDPAWIVDSAHNTPVAHRLRRERPSGPEFGGITTFSGYDSATPEQNLLAELDTIDLHHGHYSASPPYSTLVVVGASPTSELRERLARLGFEIMTTSSTGFISTRKTR